MVHLSTADLCDKFGHEAQVCAPLVSFGGRRAAWGRIATVRTLEDAALLREVLGQPGEGRILVADAGGSQRVAVLGDRMAQLGRANGWQGVVIHGAVRDIEQLAAIDFAVFALGRVPLRGGSAGIGERGLEIAFGGVAFKPEDFVCADADGIVVVPCAGDAGRFMLGRSWPEPCPH